VKNRGKNGVGLFIVCIGEDGGDNSISSNKNKWNKIGWYVGKRIQGVGVLLGLSDGPYYHYIK